MAIVRTRTYSDLDLNFTPHPITKDIIPRTGDDAVIRSIRNLIMTGFYERPFHSELGSGVRQHLFENATPLTSQQIKNAIELVINNFEPRASIKNVVVQVQEDQNAFEVALEFFITNQALPTTISVFLEKVR